MEEDILFGKKRHLYGGLEPSNMKTFVTNVVGGNVYLNAVLPKDTVIDGQTLVTVVGAVIRKSENGFPKDEFDGEFVADISEDGLYLDESASLDSVWYYAAFPYSDQGVYNRSDTNRCVHDPVSYIFGYDLDTTESDPEECVTYPEDVNNFGYKNPARMNYATNQFDYGDWTMAPGQFFMPKPCMITTDGAVDHYLDPNDYTLQEDGVTESSVADLDSGLNAMMEWPKIYTKRWEENGVYHFRCSNQKHDDTWDCWCNYDSNNNEIDHFYTAIYHSCYISNITRSLSGTTPYNNAYSGAHENYSNGQSGWHIEVIADRLLIQDLLVMMAKSTNCQAAYGDGKWGSTTILSSGTMDDKGMFWGSQDTSGDTGVKVFGMENWWGNISRYTLGCVYDPDSDTYGLKITSGTHDGTTVTGYNSGQSASGYLSFGGPVQSSTNGGGYIKTMITKPYGRLPYEFSGASATTYMCDYVAVHGDKPNSAPYVMSAVVGGNYSHTKAYIGPFHMDLNTSWNNTTPLNVGSALSFKPTKS